MTGLKTPWLATYDRLGITIPTPADISLGEYVEAHVQDFPTRPALHYMSRSWDWTAFNAEVNRLANALSALGIGRGDVVGLHMPNIPQYVFGLAAISKLGATGSGVSPLLAPPELAHQIGDAKIKVLMSYDALAPAVVAMGDAAPSCLETILFCGARYSLDAPELSVPDIAGRTVKHYGPITTEASDRFTRVKIDPTDTFMIQYTGGTTGKPKGAELSHRTLLHNPIQVTALSTPTQLGDEVYVSAFPYFHIAGLCFLLMGIISGGSSECLPDPRDTDRICAAMAARPPTRIAAVPALYDMLLANPAFATLDFSRLQVANSGAAPMTQTTFNALSQIFGANKVSDIFGMTETGPCHTSNPVKALKMGSVGIPCAGAKIRIRDVETGTRDMAFGEPGEICSAGPQLMKGYLGLPQESARAMREVDGERWMFTGDVGYMDEDGYVFLCDRAKDMLIVGGFKVFSVEVEDKLCALPQIASCAIIGTKDMKRLGNDIVNLFVQLVPEYKKQNEDELRTELLSYIRANMAAYKVPKAIHFIDAIPLTPVGKIDKKKMRASLQP